MNTPGTQSRSAVRGGRSQSLFYRDLSASPATRPALARRELGTPGQTAAAAAAAQWRENLGGGDPPPPPMFTLEDRIERSGDRAFVSDSPFRSPESSKYTEGRMSASTPLPLIIGAGGNNGYSYGDSMPGHALPPVSSSTSPQTQVSGSPMWWSASNDRAPQQEPTFARVGDKEGGSPVSGVVHPQPQQNGGLLALEPPRDVVRPEFQRVAADAVEGDEWVTVFGFGAEETNTVMRDFEKCGHIISHVSGPGGANWVHIQYQNRYDAKKALLKDGMLLNGSLIVGVKPLDPTQRQLLTERSEHPTLTVAASRAFGWGAANAGGGQASQRPYYVQRSENGARSSGALAKPAKSTISKFVDFVFGM